MRTNLCLALFLPALFIGASQDFDASKLGLWGYVDVRPRAHMFWWMLPYSGEPPQQTGDKVPLIIWFQGGPGASGSGYGNFEELGPFKLGWDKREHTWTSAADVLFLDNPVGTGFSYVDEIGLLVKNETELVADLMEFLRQFLDSHVQYQSVPLFLMGESYGGKMIVSFARAITKDQQSKSPTLKLEFRGVALGDSWISPVDFVLTWPSMLSATSLADQEDLLKMSNAALDCQGALQQGNMLAATEAWSKMESVVSNVTDGVNFYNILKHRHHSSSSSKWLESAKGSHIPDAARARLARMHSDDLSAFMNNQVRSALGNIPDHVEWGGQSSAVFESLKGDFMRDVIQEVAWLLGNNVSVTIYNGQLDLICCTLGVWQWLSYLKWPSLPEFQMSRKVPLYNGPQEGTAAFHKAHKNLEMYTIMDAGHMVPADQPLTALNMLKSILANRSPATCAATSAWPSTCRGPTPMSGTAHVAMDMAAEFRFAARDVPHHSAAESLRSSPSV